MDLIFENGNKIFDKEKEHRQEVIRLFRLGQYGHIHLYPYQKQMLDLIFNQNNKDFNIYGDDFKVEINPKNIEGNCVLHIKDYDENQKFESEININFTKDELDQFINLLKIVKNKMR
ncbi:MAG: hypothetical protein PHD03_04810 [Bacilli bacterium]|nr:hypothetical protein [Bacilli bacterium]